MGENIDKSQEEDENDMVEINSFHISSEQTIRADHMVGVQGDLLCLVLLLDYSKSEEDRVLGSGA